MPAKIAILGRPEKVENLERYYRLTMLEGGSASTNAGLPQASEEIEYTVFLSPLQAQQNMIEKMPNGKSLLVNGELTIDLSIEECPGNIGIIATSVTLVDEPANGRPTKEEEKQATEIPTATTKPNHKKKKPPAPQDLADWIIELHQKKKGICHECGQHIDKYVMQLRRFDHTKPMGSENAMILCPDCKNKKPNPAINDEFRTTPEVVGAICEKTGWTKEEAERWLLNFPRKYALVHVNEKGNFRKYWTWEKAEPFRQIVILNRFIIEANDNIRFKTFNKEKVIQKQIP